MEVTQTEAAHALIDQLYGLLEDVESTSIEGISPGTMFCLGIETALAHPEWAQAVMLRVHDVGFPALPVDQLVAELPIEVTS